MVIVSRNLERANENDGFKMTALEGQVKGMRTEKEEEEEKEEFENNWRKRRRRKRRRR